MSDEIDYTKARERLDAFAEWTGTEAPKTIVTDDGAPSEELLQYAQREELSLDWLYLNDQRIPVLGNRTQHRARSPFAVQERIDQLAELAGIEPIRVETEDGDVLITEELSKFCEEANGEFGWLLTGDPGNLVQFYHRLRKDHEPMERAFRELSEADRKGLLLAMRVTLDEGLGLEQALEVFKQARDERAAA